MRPIALGMMWACVALSHLSIARIRKIDQTPGLIMLCTSLIYVIAACIAFARGL